MFSHVSHRVRQCLWWSSLVVIFPGNVYDTKEYHWLFNILDSQSDGGDKGVLVMLYLHWVHNTVSWHAAKSRYLFESHTRMSMHWAHQLIYVSLALQQHYAV